MKISAILNRFFPLDEWSLTGEDYTTLDWRGPGDKPTLEELQALQVQLEAEALAQERRMKYPDAAKYQVREWLIDQGIDLDSIPAVLATMIPDETALKKAVNRWESVERIPRDHPLVVALGAKLGFTPEQLDAEWPTVLSL